ncbi:MAG TPA: iron export ABC transporter permease subunit FetB [Acidisoma sp.]|uniref:ABC transporter permease n=1 Tax=Acidisoma sp. TaxID=1872115 RepID=UPI002CE981C2|nr:iron export ABC transporter permease subunit FetB [Acidisoma sp.]HTI02300.1 iron export ABC transporter permease subunit FetB [Acidisoma sp.]
MNAPSLTPADLALAAALVLASAGLSLLLDFRIHRPMVVASLRMVAQLLLVGQVLRIVFRIGHPIVTLAVLAVMAAAVVYEVGARPERRLAGLWHYMAGGLPTVVCGFAIVVLALLTALSPSPWYDARVAIPLAGIILGNVMNAVSLALNVFFSAAVRERGAIEARLALGATKGQALHGVSTQALRTALIPTINQMAAAGIITLPGIMTGQLLAGMDPIGAAKYQILLMGLMLSGSFAGALLALKLAATRLTDDRHRLRLDRLRPRG